MIELLIQQTTMIYTPDQLKYSTKFNTSLIAIISRLLVHSTPVILMLLSSLGIAMEQFLSGWINKMDFIGTHYGRRLNFLGIVSVLPYFKLELMQTYFRKLMPYVLPLIENYILTKDSSNPKPSTSAALTPTKRNGYFFKILL